MTALSSASWSRFSPPSNFVNGHVSTMWFMVCRWPQSEKGDWARPHLCKLARHEPVRKRFVGDHWVLPIIFDDLSMRGVKISRPIRRHGLSKVASRLLKPGLLGFQASQRLDTLDYTNLKDSGLKACSQLHMNWTELNWTQLASSSVNSRVEIMLRADQWLNYSTGGGGSL